MNMLMGDYTDATLLGIENAYGIHAYTEIVDALKR